MKQTLFKLIQQAGAAHVFRNLKGDKITVLSVHRISDEPDFFFPPIKPASFEKLVAYCVKHYAIVTLSNINTTTKKPKLIFSFDDGYYDFVEYALPILAKYKVPCNHNFVNACLNENHIIWTQKLNDVFNHLKSNNFKEDDNVSSMIGSFTGDWSAYYMRFLLELVQLSAADRDQLISDLHSTYGIQSNYRMMSWQDLKDCHATQHVEIGSHTYTHESLKSTVDEKELEHQIGQSIDQLEKELQTPISILSLPNGQHNQKVLDYAQHRGVKFVLLVDDKLNDASNFSGDFNLISRINMVQESGQEMILRTEFLQSKLRSFR